MTVAGCRTLFIVCLSGALGWLCLIKSVNIWARHTSYDQSSLSTIERSVVSLDFEVVLQLLFHLEVMYPNVKKPIRKLGQPLKAARGEDFQLGFHSVLTGIWHILLPFVVEMPFCTIFQLRWKRLAVQFS